MIGPGSARWIGPVHYRAVTKMIEYPGERGGPGIDGRRRHPMKAATFPQSPRKLRLGRRAMAALGLLAAALAGLGWVTWRSTIDPWPARATLGTSPGTWPLGFSPDGGTFLTADLSPRVMMVTPWDVATGARGSSWPMRIGGDVPAVVFSPDGRNHAAAIVTHPSPAKVEVADAATGRLLASFATDHPIVYRLDWSPDGKSVRAYLGDNARIKEIAAWDLATGERTTGRPVTLPMRANSAGVSPDGRVLVLYAPSGKGVDLWDLEAGRSLGSLVNPATTAPASWFWAGFSADGRTLAIGRADGSVELWDVPGRKLLKSIRVHSRGHSPAVIRISPDGRTFASATWERPDVSTLGTYRQFLFGRDRKPDSEVVVVDIATGRVLTRSRTSMQPMYSPDGRTIATFEGDRGVILRDVPPSPR